MEHSHGVGAALIRTLALGGPFGELLAVVALAGSQELRAGLGSNQTWVNRIRHNPILESGNARSALEAICGRAFWDNLSYGLAWTIHGLHLALSPT